MPELCCPTCGGVVDRSMLYLEPALGVVGTSQGRVSLSAHGFKAVQLMLDAWPEAVSIFDLNDVVGWSEKKVWHRIQGLNQRLEPIGMRVKTGWRSGYRIEFIDPALQPRVSVKCDAA